MELRWVWAGLRESLLVRGALLLVLVLVCCCLVLLPEYQPHRTYQTVIPANAGIQGLSCENL
jgi:hypothetical protein